MAKKRSPKNEAVFENTSEQPPSVHDRLLAMLNELNDADFVGLLSFCR